MKDKIKVSVIIPVYQVENYLERAVESVLTQTLEEKEIILVDDGSMDQSPAICDRYAREYPDLIQVIHKENQGLGYARNTGVAAACGEYIAFLDSDDTVEPEMYQEMYEKAVEGNFDIVVCDVKIHYVEENRTTVSVTYPESTIDVSDYIARGNNITYSVNKLFRRKIWESNSYEKMLFEDIALIPSLITRYPHIGYVPKPFYNYFRRSNTISTSQIGDMVDIVKAFRRFLDRSDPAYREEVVYCAVKQLYWNMFQSRTLFQADFIELLQEYKSDIMLNSYVAGDQKLKKVFEYMDKKVIPEIFICVHFGRGIPEDYREELKRDFPQGKLIKICETNIDINSLPKPLQKAWTEGKLEYVEEYEALRLLYDTGGIVLKPEVRANLNLKRLRTNPIFFGFEDEEALMTGCFGAVRGHYVIQALLESYLGDTIFNKAYLPLQERLRDFLILHFGLRPNGRKQFLKKEISIYLPSVLAYDMEDGENCCKWVQYPCPEGYEVVSAKVLKMWSERILENWNLYKQELSGKKAGAVQSSASIPITGIPAAEVQKQLEQRTREVIAAYENSTSWRITKPLRMLGEMFQKWRKK